MQARTYMAIKGKKYYSKWSSTEHCKTSGKSEGNTSNTTPTPKPVPKLTLEEGKANITLESGRYYEIETSNGIKDINISDPAVVYSTDEAEGGNSHLFATLEPGKCVITITDIYGPKNYFHGFSYPEAIQSAY